MRANLANSRKLGICNRFTYEFANAQTNIFAPCQLSIYSAWGIRLSFCNYILYRLLLVVVLLDNLVLLCPSILFNICLASSYNCRRFYGVSVKYFM